MNVLSSPETQARAAPSDATAGECASLSIALAGSGGSGVMTAGTLLLDAAARAGLYGLMVRTSGPQIRGGEAAALLRIGRTPLESLDDRFDLLLAIDWLNINRFADEIPLHGGSLLIGDAESGEAPAVFLATGTRSVSLPLKKMVKAIPGSWINMVALGLAGALAGLPAQALEAAVRASWKRTEAALEANLKALHAGIAAAADLPGLPRLAARKRRSRARPRTRRAPAAGCSAATRPPVRARCAAACASSPPTRSRRRPSSSNGWRRRWRASAARCCRPRTSSLRST